MHGSLFQSCGVLYVGRHALSANVTAFDLDGRVLERIVSFRDAQVGRSEASGLCLDADHRLWVADGAAGRVRGFTLFGIQVANLGEVPSASHPAEVRGDDRAGWLGRPSAVLTEGSDDDLVVTVASSGRRRHAVQVLHPASGRCLSLRPLGDPQGRFEDVSDLAMRGNRELLVLEAEARRIQVFRGGEYHFQIDLEELSQGARPESLVVTGEGWIAVAFASTENHASPGVVLVNDQGRYLGTVAQGGVGEGQVQDPGSMALAPQSGIQPQRLFVMDQVGDRVQVFTLQGICYGAFPALVS